MRIHSVLLAFFGAVTVAAVSVGPVEADIFFLTNGGRIEGELLNPEQRPRENYIIQLDGGVQVTLAADQVEKVVSLRPEEAEYQRIRHQYPDTVEGQWELAEWCRQKRLLAQRDVHLQRIIELDPDHVAARRALGYSQMEGKWQTTEDVMRSRGYQRYQGAWRTKQEIELLEARRQQEQIEKEWFQKINRWRGWLGTDKGELARQSIVTIKDPLAIKALVASLRAERQLGVRLLYIEALAHLGTAEAIRVLAETAMEDYDEEVRLTCLDYLCKMPPNPEVTTFFVGYLKHKDNVLVNRAAGALGRLGDRSAVGPLIDALITRHKYKVSTGSPGTISAGFGSGPGAPPGGLAVGGGPKIVIRNVMNQPVLDALVALTGQNFHFDQQAWRYWLASQRRPESIEGRRDQ
jgi:hypothetical protein